MGNLPRNAQPSCVCIVVHSSVCFKVLGARCIQQLLFMPLGDDYIPCHCQPASNAQVICPKTSCFPKSVFVIYKKLYKVAGFGGTLQTD